MSTTSKLNRDKGLGFLISWFYIPVFLVLVGGVGYTLLLADISPLARALSIFCVVVFALIFSFTTERLLPYESKWNGDIGDSTRDIIHFCVNETMTFGPSLIVPIFVYSVPEVREGIWPSDWPLAAQIFLVLVIFDFIQNRVHWIAHIWHPLWRLHAVHHSVKRMYGFNGIMKHPLYAFISGAIGSIPLVLMGMPQEYSLLLGFTSFTMLLLQHTNVDIQTGWFRYFISTAEVHRFHHLKGKPGDVNFAAIFSFWDVFLGSAFYEDRKLKSADIGVEYTSFPVSWWQQMTAPFRRVYVIDKDQNRQS